LGIAGGLIGMASGIRVPSIIPQPGKGTAP